MVKSEMSLWHHFFFPAFEVKYFQANNRQADGDEKQQRRHWLSLHRLLDLMLRASAVFNTGGAVVVSLVRLTHELLTEAFWSHSWVVMVHSGLQDNKVVWLKTFGHYIWASCFILIVGRIPIPLSTFNLSILALILRARAIMWLRNSTTLQCS